MCLFKLYALSKFESFLREMAILRSHYIHTDYHTIANNLRLLNANMPWKSAKRSISLFYLVPYVLLTVYAQILVVPCCTLQSQ